MENIIYKHTSKTSGKSSRTVEKRLNEHLKHALNKNIKTTHFHKALLKYGIEDFSTEILEDSIYENNREKYWIDYYNTFEEDQ